MKSEGLAGTWEMLSVKFNPPMSLRGDAVVQVGTGGCRGRASILGRGGDRDRASIRLWGRGSYRGRVELLEATLGGEPKKWQELELQL